MKITREGRSLIKITALAGAEEQPEGTPPPVDCCDPDTDGFPDRAGDGNAVSLSAPGAVTLVQSTYAGNSGPDTGASTVTFSTAPTAGNVLLIWCGNRGGAALDVPSGWTTIADFTRASTDSRPLTLIGKVSDGTETTVTFGNTAGGAPESAVGQEWSGFGGTLPTSDAEAQTDFTDTTTPAVPSITPTTGISALLLVAQWKTPATPDPGPQTVSGYTVGGDTLYAGVGNRHRLTAWYKVVDPTSGSYSPGSLSAATDGTEDGIVAHVALETHPYAAAWVITEPNVNDGDDATYAAVTGTDLLRLDLGAAHRIVRTRIRIASNTSGARTLTIKGANAVDFSDEVTLGTIAYTATGSYTAQDLEATWANSTAYRYYELSSGTSDTYRIHAWELYEGNLATDVAAHLSDTSDAHDASAISIADAGGYTATTDVEAALAELYSGLMRVISPTQLAANTDNWNPTGLSTAQVIRASTDASRNLTGIVAPSIVKAIVLANIGGFDLVLKHDVTSTAANRFYCPNDTDVTLQKDSAVTLVYDTTSSRWRVVGGAGGGGGSYTDPLTTRGDLVRRGASATERVALGPVNYVLTSDGTDAVWAANTGAARGTKYHPDNAPSASSLTMSDEFDDGSLDAAWSWDTSPSATVSEATFPGFLLIDGGTNSTPTERWLSRALSLGAGSAFSIAAKVSIASGSGNNGGVYIGISAMSGVSTLQEEIGIATDGDASPVDGWRMFGLNGTTINPKGPLPQSVYLLLTRNASNVYKAYWSFDGIVWNYAGTHTNSTSITRVGIGVQSDTDQTEVQHTVDFFRVFNTETKTIGSIYATLGYLGSGIGAHAYRTTTQSIATATSTAIGYDAEVFDTHGFHDTSSNNSRMTIPTGMGGLYLVGQSFLNNDGAASWEAFFRVNGSTQVRGGGWIGQSGSTTSITSHVAPVVLQAGDYVEAMAYQGSGSSKLLGYGSDGYDARAQFWIIRIDSGSSGMGSGSVEKSYAVFDDAASAENPTPVSSTDVPDLSSITFTTTGTRDIVIRYNAGMTKGSDSDKVRFSCNIDGSSFGQEWYSQSVGESSIQQVSALWVKKALAAGTHTIKIQHNAAIGTSSTTFDDQNLVVEVLIP